MFDNNSMSAYFKMINSQKEVIRKMSVLESPAALAFRSMRVPFNERQAMMGSIKGSRSVLGSLNELNYSDKVKLGIGSSAVILAINSSIKKDIKGHQSALDSILGIHKESKKPLISGIMNPVSALKSATQILGEGWKQHQAAFGMFHEQTVKLTHIFNPTIANFIKKNVRTNYDDDDDVSVIEAAYLETFEGIKYEVNNELQNEISNTISANPGWKNTILSIAVAVKDDQLENKASLVIGNLIIKHLQVKNPVVVRVFMMMIVLLMSHGSSIVENHNNNQEHLSNRRKNISQDKKISNLESKNQRENKIKKSKENFRNSLNKSISNYEKNLLLKFKKKTAKRYTLVAALFVDYLFDHTEYTKLDNLIKMDIENFIADVRYDVLSDFEVDEIRKKLNKYLEFLEQEQGNNSKH